MATELTIRDHADALVITAKQDYSLLDALVSAFTGGAFVIIVFHAWLRLPALAMISTTAAGLGGFFGSRQRKSELRVTNLELTSKGACGDSLRSVRSISRMDVRWLEYQEDKTGPESLHPGGLYAVLRYHSVRILPYVDETQAASVIRRIAEKFPDFEDQWKGQSPFGEHFISLALDQPKSKPGK
jgi:hypothetical protein